MNFGLITTYTLNDESTAILSQNNLRLQLQNNLLIQTLVCDYSESRKFKLLIQCLNYFISLSYSSLSVQYSLLFYFFSIRTKKFLLRNRTFDNQHVELLFAVFFFYSG